MIRTPAKIGIALGLLASFAFGQSSTPATGTIQGVVFTVDTDGARSVLPAAEISLDGATHIETQSNHEGKFVTQRHCCRCLRDHRASTGIAAVESIHVTAATVSEVELEMRVQAVAESTTVTASAEPASPFAETRRLRYGHRGIHAADDVLRADRERPSCLHGVFGVSPRTRSGLSSAATAKRHAN